jgi:hypothetical protein
MLGKDKSIRSKMSVNEVAGLLEVKQIKGLLEEKCQAQTTVVDGSCELLRPARLQWWRVIAWKPGLTRTNSWIIPLIL